MRPIRSLRFPPRTSHLATRRALEAAGWLCSPDLPSHHALAAQALHGLCEASWLPFTQYRMQRVFRANPAVTAELMGVSTAFRDAYGALATSRWGQTRTETEITALAEQIAPLRIPKPKQLWLLYKVICGWTGLVKERDAPLAFWEEHQVADMMWPYLKRVLHAQRERPMSAQRIKHDLLEPDYLAVTALIARNGSIKNNIELPVPMEPVQYLNYGRFCVERDKFFPPLKDYLNAVAHDLRRGVQVNLQPAVLEIVTPHV